MDNNTVKMKGSLTGRPKQDIPLSIPSFSGSKHVLSSVDNWRQWKYN